MHEYVQDAGMRKGSITDGIANMSSIEAPSASRTVWLISVTLPTGSPLDALCRPFSY